MFQEPPGHAAEILHFVHCRMTPLPYCGTSPDNRNQVHPEERGISSIVTDVRRGRDSASSCARNDSMRAVCGNRVSRKETALCPRQVIHSPLLTRPARHLFLSPHYDDIPLSAGATVRLLADHGLTPETLVVFGSEPDRDRPLSAFAEAMHERWGLTANEVIASRQAEEAAAAAVLGAQTRVLPFRDAIYRGDSLSVGRGSLRLSGNRGGVPAGRDRRIARSRGLP